MPDAKKKKNNKKYKKSGISKRYRRKKYNKPTTSTIVKAVGGFADRAFVVLNYSRVQNMVTAGLPYDQLNNYPMNSSTLLPVCRGYSQYADVYNQAIVKWASIKLTCTSISIGPALHVMILPMSNDNNVFITPLGIYTQLLQVPYVKRGILTSANAQGTMTLKNYANVKKCIAQRPDSSSSDLSFFTGSPNSATAFSQPTDEWYWLIRFDTVDGSNILVNNYYFDIEINFGVEFFDKLANY